MTESIPMKRIVLVIGTALAFLGVAIFFVRWKSAGVSEVTVRDGPAKTEPMVAVPAKSKGVAIRLTGELSAAQSIDVISSISGRVNSIRFNPGDRVKANTTVAVVEPEHRMRSSAALEAALQKAQTERIKQKEQLAAMELELARVEDWQRKDLIAKRELEQVSGKVDVARAQFQLAEARVAQQQALLTQARALERRGKVIAPVAGVVVHRWVDPGEIVTESTPILTIVDLNRVKLISRISERDTSDVVPGMTVFLTTPAVPGKTFPGKVTRISAASRQPQQREVEIVAPSGGELRPGMVVEVIIELTMREESF